LRVGFVHPFRPTSPEELRFVLEQKWEQFSLWLHVDAGRAAIILVVGGCFTC